jgi:uncharacterized LabA/DUF88 family protein
MTERPFDGGAAFPQPYPPRAFEKAMVFIDGTNLFNRLLRAKIQVPSLLPIVSAACNGRQLLRASLYTAEEKLQVAVAYHGTQLAEGCRVVFGHSVATGSGDARERGVDALLVADLVYHAAQRNCQYAALFTDDQDFLFALERVEDFGCKTPLVALCEEAAESLKAACDDYWFLPAAWLVSKGWATAA